MGKLNESLKNTASITEVSKLLNCSRPTLYKYMECYDNGQYTLIPSRIKLYFDTVAAEDDSRASFEKILKIMEIERKSLEDRLDRVKSESKMLDKECENVSFELGRNPDDDFLKNRSRELEKKRLNNEKTQASLENKYLEFGTKFHGKLINAAESCESGPKWFYEDVMHTISGVNGNFIVIYKKPDPDAIVYMELYARISGNDEYIGRYIPGEGKNFIQITGLPSTLRYSYVLILIDEIGKHQTKRLRLGTR